NERRMKWSDAARHAGKREVGDARSPRSDGRHRSSDHIRCTSDRMSRLCFATETPRHWSSEAALRNQGDVMKLMFEGARQPTLRLQATFRGRPPWLSALLAGALAISSGCSAESSEA